jgi:phosphoribosylglycinamide formyltransferase-1
MSRVRLGILGSTRGSNLVPIVEAIQSERLNASIEVVISNKATAGILEKAKAFELEAYSLDTADTKGQSREVFDKAISEILHQHQVDLVVLIGYMRILSPFFVREWQGRVINIHPSLLPKFAGLMDLEVHQAVLDAKERSSGCTVHLVTEGLDEGPIILQATCPVLADDSKETLKTRVQALEGELLIKAIQNMGENLCLKS